MTNNYDELLKLAEAATPLETELYGDRYFQGDYSRADLTKEQDAFYRACTPAVVSGILSELTALRAAAATPQLVPDWPKCICCQSDADRNERCECPGANASKARQRAAASAPKAELTDERAAFEAAVLADAKVGKWPSPNATDRYPDGAYFYEHINIAWRMWQARAVLAQAAPAPLSAIDAAAAASAPKAELTDEHIRAAGGIVHKDGNIFFKNIDVLRAVLAQAAPVAVPEGWREFIENIATPYSEPLNSVSGYRDMASRKEMMGVLRAKAQELLAAAPAAPVAAAVPVEPNMLWLVDDEEEYAQSPAELAHNYALNCLNVGEVADVQVHCAFRANPETRTIRVGLVAGDTEDEDRVEWAWIDPAAPAPDGAAS